ncbi:hypothetical protein PQ692_14875 (plasmid) [Thermoanaerobacterium thermosaccharolyticum]|uniref:hypothetical protein n=1 Tax=Thermoanaerobacterium thermosaccharolyticum TaxID=1517 RepID=UPI003DA90D3E
MRKKLKMLKGKRDIFYGTFVRYGTKSGWKGTEEKTILLSHIKDKSGKEITDHLWFNYTKGFQSLNLQPGDTVQFTARVKEYWKGYAGYRYDIYKPIEKDYKLSYPTKIKKVNQ